jgi:mannose/fructose/N-acetylgalactosamine-specific phosphotransferase system component IID
MVRRTAVPAPPARLLPAAFLLQASWNYERQQGIGFGAALAAALRQLGVADGDRAAFLRRHVQSFNTNPVMAPWVLGAVARLESQRAREGAPSAGEIDRLKTALSIHLARIGDSVIWSGLRPLASAVGIALALAGVPWAAAAAAWALYNAAQVPLRIAGLRIGYREGAAVVERLVSPTWNRAFERMREAGGVLAGVAAGLLCAQASGSGSNGIAPDGAPATGPVTALLTVAAIGVALVTLERRRGGATGIALVALAAAAALAAVGLS